MKVLVATTGALLDGERAAAHQAGSDSLAVLTQAGSLAPGALATAHFDAVSLDAPAPAGCTPELLAQLLAALVPGGRLAVTLGQQAAQQDAAALQKQLVLAGFVDCRAAPSDAGNVAVEAQKPSWQSGAKSSITLKPNTAAPAKQAWTLGGGDDDELLDDEELLTEEDRQRPAAPADCGASRTKKACANCTCGRAEGQIPAKVELTQAMLDNPQPAGGCGSCSLGDAFRCSTCPYRGLPAFEPGKKIELANDFLTADA